MLPSSKSPSLLPLIINDLTKDDEFKALPFFTSYTSLRFYAAMPISTKAGFNIGSLCVMDDKPRDGMSDVEKRFLGDIAITIMAHLEKSKVKEEHRRCKKMVKGLGLFVEGGSTVREGWLEVGNDMAWGQHGSKDGVEAQSNEENISTTKATGSGVEGRFDQLDNPSLIPQPKPAVDTLATAQAETTVQLPPTSATQRDCGEISPALNLGNRETHSFPTPVSSNSATPDRTQDASPIRSAGGDQPSTNSGQSSTTDLQETILSENLKEMFSRASNIIRECIEVDGIIFLDASIGTFGGDTGESDGRLGQSGSIERRSQESL